MTEPEFKVNLCTFMGRKNNVQILLQYVEEALEIGAIDHYWMIDMTRNLNDHDYIFSEQQRLDGMFPGRVHVVNRDIRAKQLKDDTVGETLGSWAPFYEFCAQFNDNDVIIKCDDDTLYFDVETIRAAAEIRFKNKHPFLMHGNTINNGVCAYHQNKARIWQFEDADILGDYPTSGLTGPLFSHPEIACECHKQFISDLCKDERNINKYKLKSNPYFTARVSINMIFMLGSDRDIISKIDTQDEYVCSSKIGQQLDRPNMIIGDFLCAHHTYGVQEPVMEELGTHELFVKLSDTIFRNKKTRVNKKITQPAGSSLRLKSDDVYLARYWSTNDSVVIKNDRTGKYINLEWNKTERIKFIPQPDGTKKRVGTGVYWYKADLTPSDKPLIFNIADQKAGNLQIQDCTEIIKSSQPGFDGERFMAFPVKKWFQQNYKKQLVTLTQLPDKLWSINTDDHPGFTLVCDDRNPDHVLYFFKDKGEDKWEVTKMNHTNDMLVPIELDRGNQTECENDPTTARVTNDSTLPECKVFREFYWMVNNYLWEMIPTGDEDCYIKLIADDLKDMYLVGNNDKTVQLGSKPDIWTYKNNTLSHKSTQYKLSINKTGVTLTSNGSILV